MRDEIVEECRRVREELISKHGGIDGYVKHLQAQERAGAAKAKARRSRQSARRKSKANASKRRAG